MGGSGPSADPHSRIVMSDRTGALGEETHDRGTAMRDRPILRLPSRLADIDDPFTDVPSAAPGAPRIVRLKKLRRVLRSHLSCPGGLRLVPA